MMSLSKRIRDCRYAKGWGPDELASRAEISRTALYQIECGKTETPRAGTLRRIARALEVPIDRLLGLEDREFCPAVAPRSVDLDYKFHELLASPLGEGLARLVEESYQMLPRAEARAS
jgi:transcriptional regulator with XRE-family HTH domain